jgi:hypothetical protein
MDCLKIPALNTFPLQVKINQFPGLFIIGRKDNLWLIFEKMREKYGPEEFDFCPTTYILPRQRDQLVR